MPGDDPAHQQVGPGCHAAAPISRGRRSRTEWPKAHGLRRTACDCIHPHARCRQMALTGARSRSSSWHRPGPGARSGPARVRRSWRRPSGLQVPGTSKGGASGSAKGSFSGNFHALERFGFGPTISSMRAQTRSLCFLVMHTLISWGWAARDGMNVPVCRRSARCKGHRRESLSAAECRH